MPATSEARIEANRKNALKSTGPKSASGKEQSRRNGLKHGMSGRGIVLPEEDAPEVEKRASALMTELAPKSTLGVVLVGQLATLSVRMERGARQEEAATASRVRHASEAFDVERVERADQLLETLELDPRGNLRRLRAFPEGVDRLIVAWDDLRAELTRSPRPNKPTWTPAHFDRLANLLGFRGDDSRVSQLKAMSQAFAGDLQWLADDQGAGLDDLAGRDWARDRLVERIDAEVASLEAHYETFDFAAIERDRIEAPERALFDSSREATLARRYESEARRGFFKALKDLRQAEAELTENITSKEFAETDAVTPNSSLGSCRETRSAFARVPHPAPVEVAPGLVRPVSKGHDFARGLDGQVLAIGRAGFAAG